MQANILLTIEQVWIRFPEISGMYVDESTLSLCGKVEVYANTIVRRTSPPPNFLSIDTRAKRLIPFSANVSHYNYNIYNLFSLYLSPHTLGNVFLSFTSSNEVESCCSTNCNCPHCFIYR